MSSGLENKVSSLETTACQLEKTLAALKAQSSGGEDRTALAAKLKELMNLLLEDRNECESIRAQRDDLKEENDRLRVQLSKQEYRVKHLLRTIEEIEAKQK